MMGKWIARASSNGYSLFSFSAFAGQAADMRTPVMIARGAAIKTVLK